MCCCPATQHNTLFFCLDCGKFSAAQTLRMCCHLHLCPPHSHAACTRLCCVERWQQIAKPCILCNCLDGSTTKTRAVLRTTHMTASKCAQARTSIHMQQEDAQHTSQPVTPTQHMQPFPFGRSMPTHNFCRCSRHNISL